MKSSFLFSIVVYLKYFSIHKSKFLIFNFLLRSLPFKCLENKILSIITCNESEPYLIRLMKIEIINGVSHKRIIDRSTAPSFVQDNETMTEWIWYLYSLYSIIKHLEMELKDIRIISFISCKFNTCIIWFK